MNFHFETKFFIFLILILILFYFSLGGFGNRKRRKLDKGFFRSLFIWEPFSLRWLTTFKTSKIKMVKMLYYLLNKIYNNRYYSNKIYINKTFK